MSKFYLEDCVFEKISLNLILVIYNIKYDQAKLDNKREILLLSKERYNKRLVKFK